MGSLGRLSVLAALLLVPAGCGGTEAAGEDRPPRYQLTITFWPTGRGGEARTATLTCDPDGGTHPNPGSACDALLEHEDALEPVAGDVACTQIYGGDQVAAVSGGATASFSRVNGCEIARWDQLAPLLELAG